MSGWGERAAVTDFTIYSIMIILDQSGKLEELKTFILSLSAYKGLTLHAPSTSEKFDAIGLITAGKLDVDDAIQYASARNLAANGIVSLDTHFDNQDIPRIDPGTFASA